MGHKGSEHKKPTFDKRYFQKYLLEPFFICSCNGSVLIGGKALLEQEIW